MSKKLVKQLFFVSLLAVIVYACIKDDTFDHRQRQQERELRAGQLCPMEAREWFENDFRLRVTNIVHPELRERLMPPLNWGAAQMSGYGQWDVVELPWPYESAVGRRPLALRSVWEYHEEQNQQPEHFVRLVVLQDRQADTVFVFKMKIAPTLDYLRNHGENLQANRYLQRCEHLSGLVMFFTLCNQFINGWVYREGVIVSALASGRSQRVRDRNFELKGLGDEMMVLRSSGPDDVAWNIELNEVVVTAPAPTQPTPTPGTGSGSGSGSGGGSWGAGGGPPMGGVNPDNIVPPIMGGGGGSGNSGSGSNSNSGVGLQLPTAILAPTLLTIEMGNRYTPTVTLIGAGSSTLTVISVEFEMRRRYRANAEWVRVHTGTSLYFERMAWTPGFWEMRAIVMFTNGQITSGVGSNSIVIEEQFPTRNRFFENIALRNYLRNTLWPQAIEYARNRPPYVREFGAFIRMSRDGTFYPSPMDPGDPVAMDRIGVRATINVDVHDDLYATLPPQTTCSLIVGTMHTHYPITWASVDMTRRTGPSPCDERANAPGILIDYAAPMIRTRHNENDPIAFSPYGVLRRATPR